METAKRRTVAFSLLAVILVLSNHVAAQEEYGPRTQEPKPDSVIVPNRSIIGFERDLNTYFWRGQANYRGQIGDWNMRLGELFLSTLIQTDQKFIKDEQNFGLSLGRKFTEKAGVQLDASSLFLSDNHPIEINRASIHSLLAGMMFQPRESDTIVASIGIKSDSQTGQTDNGLSYRIISRIGELNLSGYETNFYGKFSEDLITPRKGESHAAALSVEKNFLQQTKDSLGVQFLRNRRDFYFPADSLVALSFGVTNNIEQRIEEIIDVTNQLRYVVGRDMLLTFNMSLYHRGISKNINYKAQVSPLASLYDTDISEFKLDAFVQGQYETERAGAVLRLAYGERDEDHQAKPFAGFDRNSFDLQQANEQRKNNSTRRTTITGNARAAVTAGNVLSVSGFASLLRYDTPSADNTDDRDELLMIFGLSDRQKIGSNTTFWVTADAVLNHIVYLFADRSANNNWNRVVRLSPRVEYEPSSRLKTTNAFEVLANYTVYDFEDQVFSVKSFSFRQFSFIDSTTIQLSRRVAMDLSLRVKLYERGQLSWREFKERPVNYFDDRTYWGQFRYTPNVSLTFAVGFRYFSLTRFRYDVEERVFDNRLVNYGPTCLIEWSADRDTRLLVSGWYEAQAQTGGPTESVSNVALSIILGL
jgi:hypothetical protein